MMLMRMAIRRMMYSSGCSPSRYRATRLVGHPEQQQNPWRALGVGHLVGCGSMDPMLCAAGVLLSLHIVAPTCAGVQDYSLW